jgi:S1-C subfamily serine protease
MRFRWSLVIGSVSLAAVLIASCGKLPYLADEHSSLLYRKIPFMVRIEDNDGVFRGSGFVVSERGLVLTVSHVVQYADPIYVTFNGKPYPAETVFDDPILDITLLRLPLRERVPAMYLPCFWDSSSIQNGDTVMILGQRGKGGVDMMPGYMISWASFKIWPGSYEHVYRIYPDDPQNVPRPGFSGGPIFNIRQHVIGLFCCLESLEDRYYNGIPSSRILERLKDTEWRDELCVVPENEPFPLPGFIFDIQRI